MKEATANFEIHWKVYFKCLKLIESKISGLKFIANYSSKFWNWLKIKFQQFEIYQKNYFEALKVWSFEVLNKITSPCTG